MKAEPVALDSCACEVRVAAPPCRVICPLSHLPRGGCARVVTLAGAPRWQRRLMALGIRPSAELAVLGRAPGNGPLELRAGSVHLMLRASEAAAIMVEVDHPHALLHPQADAHALPTL